jgi:MFS transporter, putative metabolite:H+ symporter
MIKKEHLFLASCVALTTTSLTFGIRAGMLDSWATEFQLTKEQVGVITAMAFFGFPIATVLGGLFLDKIGMRPALLIAFLAHLIGLVMTVFAGGYTTLLLSTLFVGFANGAVEAACNPLIATLYPKDTTKMFNRFHVWFPAGIVIGAVTSYLLTSIGIGWRIQCGIILLPAIAYGFMFFGQKFPQTDRVTSGVSTADMFKAVFANPLFYFLALCMMLTANTELSTGQWITNLLKNVGINGLLVLAIINGLMAIGRFYAGPVVHKLNEEGVLLGSSIFAAIGLYLLSTAASPVMIVAAALVFAIGVCYFWPTMLGYIAKHIPKSGALGLSLLGASGMLATAIFQPIIGGWFDSNKVKASAQLTGVADSNALVDPAKLAEAIDFTAGKMTLQNVALLPLLLILAFGALYFFKGRKTNH